MQDAIKLIFLAVTSVELTTLTSQQPTTQPEPSPSPSSANNFVTNATLKIKGETTSFHKLLCRLKMPLLMQILRQQAEHLPPQHPQPPPKLQPKFPKFQPPPLPPPPQQQLHPQ